MSKSLSNRQRVKNPRKRERYTAPKKSLPPAGGSPRRKLIERLLRRVSREGSD